MAKAIHYEYGSTECWSTQITMYYPVICGYIHFLMWNIHFYLPPESDVNPIQVFWIL